MEVEKNVSESLTNNFYYSFLHLYLHFVCVCYCPANCFFLLVWVLCTLFLHFH